MKKPDLSIVIVNHNARDFLQGCLLSIKKQQGLNIETIVVDNKSQDGSCKMVKEKFPHVICLERDTEEGFSAANNVGVKKATADTVLFLNPDTLLNTSNDLKKCYDRLWRTKNLGILTSKLVMGNGRIDHNCHRGFPTPWATFNHFYGLEKAFPRSPLFAQYLQSYKGYDSEHKVDAAAGAFMMVKKVVGETIGWWDEDYVFYGEDLDFCYRAKEAGFSTWYYPKVIVTHYKGVSSGMGKYTKSISTASHATRKRAKLHSIEAMNLFVTKHYSDRYPKPFLWFLRAGISLLKTARMMLA